MANLDTHPARSAALGLRVHSGWVALVAVAGSIKHPLVADRRRLELVESNASEQAQPYHAAAKLDPSEAEGFIEHCLTIARSIATRSVGEVLCRLQGDGYRVESCGILLSSATAAPDLSVILRSHALIHSAEGQFFREVLLGACRHHGLAVSAVRERQLYQLAALELGMPESELKLSVADMGRQLQPPWTQDQKSAALVACLALAAQGNPGH